MFLTDRKIKLEKPDNKVKFLNDGNGLQLEIKPHGIKLWRYRCTINGKRTRLSLGEYPAISLKAAREKRDELKALIAQGIDPRTVKETPKEEDQPFTSVKDMVERYLDHYRADRNEKYWQGVESLFGVMYCRLLETCLSKRSTPNRSLPSCKPFRGVER